MGRLVCRICDAKIAYSYFERETRALSFFIFTIIFVITPVVFATKIHQLAIIPLVALAHPLVYRFFNKKYPNDYWLVVTPGRIEPLSITGPVQPTYNIDSVRPLFKSRDTGSRSILAVLFSVFALIFSAFGGLLLYAALFGSAAKESGDVLIAVAGGVGFILFALAIPILYIYGTRKRR